MLVAYDVDRSRNSMCNNFHCCFSSEGFEDGQNGICLLDYSLLSDITLR